MLQPKYEPSSGKARAKQRSSNSESEASSRSSFRALSSGSSKPNTPPLLASSSSLASFALGLGSSFKSTSFKIPKAEKSRKGSDEDERKEDRASLKTPLSASSPLVNSNAPSNYSRAFFALAT